MYFNTVHHESTANFHLSRIYREKELYFLAEKNLLIPSKARPNDINLQCEWIILYLSKGELELAEKYYERNVEKIETLSKVLMEYRELTYAYLLSEKGEYEKAEAIFVKLKGGQLEVRFCVQRNGAMSVCLGEIACSTTCVIYFFAYT